MLPPYLGLGSWGSWRVGIPDHSYRDETFLFCALAQFSPTACLAAPASSRLSPWWCAAWGLACTHPCDLAPAAAKSKGSESLGPQPDNSRKANELVFMQYLLAARHAAKPWGFCSHYLFSHLFHCTNLSIPQVSLLPQIMAIIPPCREHLQHLLPWHSLALNSPCDLSCIFMFCCLNCYLNALCFESVKAEPEGQDLGLSCPTSGHLPLLSWTFLECRSDPRGGLQSPSSKERLKEVPGVYKHLHWAFLNDREIYSLSAFPLRKLFKWLGKVSLKRKEKKLEQIKMRFSFSFFFLKKKKKSGRGSSYL